MPEEFQSAQPAENANEADSGSSDAKEQHAPTDTQGESTLLNTVTETNDSKNSADTEEQKADPEKEEKLQGAPEEYEEFKAPEGLQYNSKVIDAFKGVAKTLNLSQDNAQVLLDQMAPVIAEQQLSRIQEISSVWREKTLKDPEIGGDKWTRCSADIARVRDKFAKGNDGQIDPDIAEFMNSPAGNHPGVLKLLARVGRAFGEGDFPTGDARPESNPLANLYDKTKFK